MTSIPKDLYHDLEAPAFDPHYEFKVERARKQLALEKVQYLAREALENNPADLRTGCVVTILRAVAEVLIKEKGWTSRQAADAMVMEGVRAGGELEREAGRISRKKWLAARREREGGAS